MYSILLLVCSVLVSCRCDGPLDAQVFVDGGNADGGLRNITIIDVYNAMKMGQSLEKDRLKHDKGLFALGVYMLRNNSGFLRFDTGKIPAFLDNLNQASHVMSKGMRFLMEKNLKGYNLSFKQFINQLIKRKFRVLGVCNITTDQGLKPNRTVLSYRTFDGSYNNLKYPTWGMQYSTYPRLVDPDYADAIHAPRISVTGRDLPNPRMISVKVFSPIVNRDGQLSMVAAEMTQVISHDITSQQQDLNLDTGPVQCCKRDGSAILPESLLHQSCYPIEIAANDTFYSQYRQGCMNFVRSITAPNRDCTLSSADQVNSVTGYLDGSLIYGSSFDLAQSLRTLAGGRLRESTTGKPRQLPHAEGQCDTDQKGAVCYEAGDNRVNQQVHLSSVQTLFMREHNRIANTLKSFNPQWNDERLFQEARRIVIAEYQHIVYNEMLPLLFDSGFFKTLFGKADENGFTYNYDGNINGACLNSFTIAFRGLHSVIPPDIRLYNESRRLLSKYMFSDMLFKQDIMESTPNNFDNIVRGMAYSDMMKISTCVTQEVTNKLFKSRMPYGLDLIATDIQRGRDHGIPGYNTFRQFCGLSKVSKFEDLAAVMSNEKIDSLKKVYLHPDDIDLIVGGLMELPQPGCKFGPVFQCLFKDQFYKFMVGDRFFYTNKMQDYPFTPGQLRQIKKMSFSGLVCYNSDNVIAMPRRSLEVESDSNPRVPCDSLNAKVDLSYWKESSI